MTSLARLALVGALLALAGCTAGDAQEPSQPSPPPPTVDVSAELTDLEGRYDARLGVYALDTGTGTEVAWRADERFAYASTFKVLAAAAVLDEVGIAGLEQQVPITAGDLLVHSPVTQTRIGGSMTLRELAEAAVTVSDNPAANLLVAELGGPQALDDALTELGDDVTTVSRTEPVLNEATPGDERDTTTPRAIAQDLHEYVLGETLDEQERALVVEWLTGSQTGDTLVRADLPPDWTVGDKSGTGDYGTRNDVAVIWPPDEAPIVIAVLSSRDEPDAEHDDRLIAEAAAAVVAALRPRSLP